MPKRPQLMSPKMSSKRTTLKREANKTSKATRRNRKAVSNRQKKPKKP